MNLTQEQIQHFQQHGYLPVQNFWSAREVRAMQLELERLKEEGLLRNVTTEGDGTTHSNTRQNLQLCPMYNHSRLFRTVPFVPKVVAAISSLIGDPYLLHLDQVFLKPGLHGAGTNWHQDNAYFKIADPMKGTALWTAVHDATLANGTMRIIPDAFHEPIPHQRDLESDHHIRCYPDEARAIPVELSAGGVLFFCYGTPHSTGANQTEKERAGVALHFLRQDYASPELIQPDRDCRPYITGPDSTGGLKEYGEVMTGTWESQVESLAGESLPAAIRN